MTDVIPMRHGDPQSNGQYFIKTKELIEVITGTKTLPPVKEITYGLYGIFVRYVPEKIVELQREIDRLEMDARILRKNGEDAEDVHIEIAKLRRRLKRVEEAEQAYE